MMRLLQKVVRPEPNRPTRLHDVKGQFVGWSRLARNAPPALVTGAARLLWGGWPEQPWLSYYAVRAMAAHLARTPGSRVLEFGSGFSTLWFARRCGQLCSVEDSPAWYGRVRGLLRDLPHVTYELCVDPDAYVQAAARHGGAFDLILVDGSHRHRCVEEGLAHLAPGGILYLDNTDGGLSATERLLREAASERGGRVLSFTDFAPTQLYASEGLMYIGGGRRDQ